MSFYRRRIRLTLGCTCKLEGQRRNSYQTRDPQKEVSLPTSGSSARADYLKSPDCTG